MELFAPVLTGSYAYILVFQLMIVTTLFLTLVYLVVQRVRTAPTYRDIGKSATMTAPAPAPKVAIAAHASTEAADMAALAAQKQKAVENAGPSPELLELQAKYLDLEQNYNQAKSAGGVDARPLQEKIKFLESKLLEYEILQEEISTLGQLKVENEKLKADIVRVERDLASFTGAPPPGENKPAPGIEPSSMSEPEKTAAEAAVPGADPSMEGLMEKIEGLASQATPETKDKAE